MRVSAPLALLCFLIVVPRLGLCQAQGSSAAPMSLPDAPSFSRMVPDAEPAAEPAAESSSSSLWADVAPFNFFPGADPQAAGQQTPDAAAKAARESDHAPTPAKPANPDVVDANGKVIPLEQRQPQRILGFMPNFRSVSGGSVPPRPSFRYNFKIATRQAFDYSSFIFLGITSMSAEGLNSHPALGKGVHGFYSYTWRGFLDKTDGTYLQGWLLPSILHEDTRYYALGHGSIFYRSLYVISRQGVTRTYGGRQTPNIAGLGGKVLTQVISRTYYPTGATSFSVLATKFGYAAMRDIAFSSIREFYPQIAAHYIRNHRAKMARLASAQP